MSAALKVPKNTVASIILKWKKFGTTKTLPRAGCLTKLSNRGRRALVREVTKDSMVTDRTQECLCGDGRTFQKDNHLCSKRAFMVEWPDGSYSSRKGTCKPAWSLPKGTERTLRPLVTRFSGLMKPRLNSLS